MGVHPPNISRQGPERKAGAEPSRRLMMTLSRLSRWTTSLVIRMRPGQIRPADRVWLVRAADAKRRPARYIVPPPSRLSTPTSIWRGGSGHLRRRSSPPTSSSGSSRPDCYPRPALARPALPDRRSISHFDFQTYSAWSVKKIRNFTQNVLKILPFSRHAADSTNKNI